MSGPSSVSFPFSVGDPVHLSAVPHIGGTVSSMSVSGGTAQRVKVRHFDLEGDSVDREFDATDLAAGAATEAVPAASHGAPPSAATPTPTPVVKTTPVPTTPAAAAAPPAAAAAAAAPKPAAAAETTAKKV
jgi:hypothetical protein